MIRPFERLDSDSLSFSQVSNRQALEGILEVSNAATIYKITLNNLPDNLQEFQDTLTGIVSTLKENIVFVWENTVPLNTIKFLDILSEIQLNSKTPSNFTFTHKCYKESSLWSFSAPSMTCVFMTKAKPSEDLQSFSTFRRLTEEKNTTNTDSGNTTKPSPTNTTKPGTETTPTKPTQNSGNEHKPPKTEITTVQAKSSFQSVILVLIIGLAIAALVFALLKYRKKWKIKKILAGGGSRSNKKIDVQKLIIKPSFLNLNHQQGESGIGSMSSGTKGKRTLFLSDTNYAMSPVIDVKTIHHLNLEENHRSSMIPEEVILTNIDDSQESKDSSKSSVDASPQDLGFNIEFSMLEVQESSKFQSKNLKSEE